MTSKDFLQALIYTLLRDEIVPGSFERVMKDIETAINIDGADSFVFSNKHLAEYANSIIERIYKYDNNK